MIPFCILYGENSLYFNIMKVGLNELDKVPKISIVTGWDEKLTSSEENALKADFIVNKTFKFSALANKINVLFDNG